MSSAESGESTQLPPWLTNYPKSRPPLDERYQKIYESEYVDNRSGAGIVSNAASKLEGWMHNRVAGSQATGAVTLEIGAGTLNHLNYESVSGAYDIVEPFERLYRDVIDTSPVRNAFKSIHDVPQTAKYDRIISVAALEHITDLPQVVAKAGTLLSPGGTFSAGIPTEGGALWYLAWRFGTGIPFYLRHGLDYGPYMRHEHVNTAKEITEVLRYCFRHVDVQRFPVNAFHGSFYSFLECSDPVLDRCSALAEGPNASCNS
ncbi:MAG: methyltransferase domain-containing protein [Halieaceae bacterium]|nr:methyltransferase domain-containing protein [Halieaceae bacterium]